jgi:hypothetical protein
MKYFIIIYLIIIFNNFTAANEKKMDNSITFNFTDVQNYSSNNSINKQAYAFKGIGFTGLCLTSL